MNNDKLPKLGAPLTDLHFGTIAVLKANARLSELSMRFVAIASCIDYMRTRAFKTLLRSDHRVASALLDEIPSAHGRIKAIEAAGSLLPATDRKVLAEVLGWTSEVDGIRSVISGWLWAHSPSRPDELLLVRPDDAVEVVFAHDGSPAFDAWKAPRGRPARRAWDWYEIVVLTEPVLDNLILEALYVSQALLLLKGYLQRGPDSAKQLKLLIRKLRARR